jgi:hypothetical protein
LNPKKTLVPASVNFFTVAFESQNSVQIASISVYVLDEIVLKNNNLNVWIKFSSPGRLFVPGSNLNPRQVVLDLDLPTSEDRFRATLLTRRPIAI